MTSAYLWTTHGQMRALWDWFCLKLFILFLYLFVIKRLNAKINV